MCVKTDIFSLFTLHWYGSQSELNTQPTVMYSNKRWKNERWRILRYQMRFRSLILFICILAPSCMISNSSWNVTMIRAPFTNDLRRLWKEEKGNKSKCNAKWKPCWNCMRWDKGKELVSSFQLIIMLCLCASLFLCFFVSCSDHRMHASRYWTYICIFVIALICIYSSFFS